MKAAILFRVFEVSKTALLDVFHQTGQLILHHHYLTITFKAENELLLASGADTKSPRLQ